MLAPAKELQTILLPALSPCSGFDGPCKDYARWDPANGHVPRGYLGATAYIADVRLLLVTAEPGDPADSESYRGASEQVLDAYVAFAMGLLEDLSLRRKGKPAPFHKNLRRILDYCWPGIPFAEQMRRTWITPAMLCSAKTSGGSAPSAVTSYCAERYLANQLDLLGDAFVVALGAKAASRLRNSRCRCDFEAQHPSARANTNPDVTWQAAGAAFRSWLEARRGA